MLYPSSTPIEQLQAITAYLKSNNNYSKRSVQDIRAAALESSRQLPLLEGVNVEPVEAETFSGEWVRADGESLQCTGHPQPADNKVILYFHGGGFVSDSSEIYRDLAARLSEAAGGITVLTVEYRLAPEFCYPAANEDCLAAYHWLLERGVHAGNIILCGDSIGATLALMTLITLREQGDRLLLLPAFYLPMPILFIWTGSLMTAVRERTRQEAGKRIRRLFWNIWGTLAVRGLRYCHR